MTSMDKIKVGTPIRLKDHLLVPIEKSSVSHDTAEAAAWCRGSKELIALVVQTSSGMQAFDMDGGQIAISELKKTVPGIQAYLNDNH